MVGRVFYKNFANSDEFEGPQTERNVYLFQFCPEFRKRDGIYPQPTCFFCCYADFNLTGDIAFEVGICCYPAIVNGSRKRYRKPDEKNVDGSQRT